ncbi:MAG: DUF4349 domain-containing protein [Acidimicrobiales bacterium]
MRYSRTIAAAALSMVVLASCGSDSDSATSSLENYDSASVAPAEASAAGVSGETAASSTTDQTATAGRLIARTAAVNVLVEDLSASIAEATAIATRADGFVAQEQTSQYSSELTFKVPSDTFDSVLRAFGELGVLDSQWITSEDRTTQIIDLQARLDTAEASLARTRELFDAAKNVTDLVTAENEIAQREEAVEVLKAQLRSQESSVSMATISVYLTIDPDSLPAEPVVDDDDLPTIRRAFANGLDLLWYVVRLMGISLAWLAPWTPIIALGAYAARSLRRRRANRPPAPAKQSPSIDQQWHAPVSGATPPPPGSTEIDG